MFRYTLGPNDLRPANPQRGLALVAKFESARCSRRRSSRPPSLGAGGLPAHRLCRAPSHLLAEKSWPLDPQSQSSPTPAALRQTLPALAQSVRSQLNRQVQRSRPHELRCWHLAREVAAPNSAREGRPLPWATHYQDGAAVQAPAPGPPSFESARIRSFRLPV